MRLRRPADDHHQPLRLSLTFFMLDLPARPSGTRRYLRNPVLLEALPWQEFEDLGYLHREDEARRSAVALLLSCILCVSFHFVLRSYFDFIFEQLDIQDSFKIRNATVQLFHQVTSGTLSHVQTIVSDDANAMPVC